MKSSTWHRQSRQGTVPCPKKTVPSSHSLRGQGTVPCPRNEWLEGTVFLGQGTVPCLLCLCQVELFIVIPDHAPGGEMVDGAFHGVTHHPFPAFRSEERRVGKECRC